jgi:hypothetical protein
MITIAGSHEGLFSIVSAHRPRGSKISAVRPEDLGEVCR